MIRAAPALPLFPTAQARRGLWWMLAVWLRVTRVVSDRRGV